VGAWIGRKNEDDPDCSEPCELVLRYHDEEEWLGLEADLLGLDSVLTDIASEIASGWTAAV
jgi:hypothetical protein